MKSYPNYRVAIEAIIVHNGKVLLTKRTDEQEIAPSIWCVPSGKVKYDEIPHEALYREVKEETNLDVQLVKELDVRTFELETSNGAMYRLMYTYLVKPLHNNIDNFKLNDEHSDYVWISIEELASPDYSNLHDNLKRIIPVVFIS